MAVARPQQATQNTGIKAALIAFVVLTLAALGGVIFLYTQQEDLRGEAERASDQAQRVREEMQAAQQQRNRVVEKVLGAQAERNMEPAEVQQAIKEALAPVYDHPQAQEAGIVPDKEVPLVKLAEQIFQLFASNNEKLNQLRSEHQQLQDRITSLTDNLQSRQEEYQSTVQQLSQRVQELEAQNEENRQKWQKEVDGLSQQMTEASQQADTKLNEMKQQMQGKAQELAEAKAQVRELQDMLASFRPRGDIYAAIQIADGRVVQVPAGEDIVYISLGRQDDVQAGLTFEVYSRHEKIPADGKGKASLRVSHVFDTTAECKILRSTPGNPILEQDLVANPVFAKDRRYNFLVAGDFDLDFDGDIDDPGGRQVAQMIRKAGGKIVEEVTTDTDFVVLGSAPPAPKPLPEGTEDEAAMEKNRELEVARKAFMDLLKEAQSMAVPILTRTQFLHFAGIGVPDHVEQDNRPILAWQ
jgi:uncharacterized coiled-coil DUF342 family protein